MTLAKAGATIVVCAKSVKEKKNLPGTVFTVAAEIEQLGGRALAMKCDVRQDEDILNVVATTKKEFGRIDILVCNAGALWWKDVKDTPMRRYDLINEVNSRGTFAFTRACLPHMLEQGHGRIVTMSPPIDLRMLKGKVAYSISKFGMTLTAMGLAQETEGTGVAINALWPATMVESYATINFELGDPSLWRKASIIADATLMLCKEPASFSGQALIDEFYMRDRGITDFKQYRCNPDVEPPAITEVPSSGVGLVEENSLRALKNKLAAAGAAAGGMARL